MWPGLALFLLTAVPVDRYSPRPAPVELRVVNHAQLMDAVKAHRGKVVVVYFWAEYSVPDKKEFPRFVALHHKYPGRVAVLSVSLDAVGQDPEPPAVLGRIRRFLTARRAAFSNFVLDEEPEVWMDRLKICMPPAVVVYDRTGRPSRTFDLCDPPPDVTLFDQAEGAVKELLAGGRK